MRNFLVIGNSVTTVAGSKIISLNAERIEDDTMEHTGGIFLHTKAPKYSLHACIEYKYYRPSPSLQIRDNNRLLPDGNNTLDLRHSLFLYSSSSINALLS